MWVQRYKKLLKQWCEAMLALQIPSDAPKGLRGGILCPACARVHGRSLDALYPFVFMADETGDQKWLNAAKRVFDWAESTVSRQDGAYACDTNNAWYGITVFSVVQMCEALKYHRRVLDDETVHQWKARVKKAADFLLEYPPVYEHNVNYRFANTAAMQMCGELLGEKTYFQKAKECAAEFDKYLTKQGLLFGEGVPPEGWTQRGCRPIDIGYNVEESLPSLAMYSKLAGNEELARKVADVFAAHLTFMLPDGAWDNSFGTRNFKWTYWGSRTSDGCLLGCLLSAKYRPECRTGAQRNFELLERCTHDGLLHGGMEYHKIGERPCVHHTFEHAKVLAAILDQRLSLSGASPELPRAKISGTIYYPEIDTFLVGNSDLTATITGYDWEYLKGGHASGGNLTMLWHSHTGPICCATMNEYSMYEPNNQQLPRFEYHECLSPRLEYIEDGTWYTTLYDIYAVMNQETNDTITVQGGVRDREYRTPHAQLTHKTKYRMRLNAIEIEIHLSEQNGIFVCPLISACTESIRLNGNCVEVEKNQAIVTLLVETGELRLPYGQQRCYNLVGGMQAVKTEIVSKEKVLRFRISVKEKK